MGRAFTYGKDLDVFRVEPDGALVTRYYTKVWQRYVISGPGQQIGHAGCNDVAVVGAKPSIVRDYAQSGRLDVFVDAVDGGEIHAWFTPNVGWSSERLL